MKALVWHGKRDVRIDHVPTRGSSSRPTRHLPLTEAPRAYQDFQEKADGTFKVVFHP